jgi:serine/threonine-protein kinase
MAHLLARQYELVTVIGHGPTGEVWRATDLNTRETVAVKVLHPRLSADRTIVDRFVRERQILKAFLHPAYVRVRDLVAGDGLIALVMEYVSGWDLRRHVGHSGGLPPALVAEIGLGVAEALAAAHDAGVVHCDLKPSNVLLAEPSGEARLTDCRVARLAHGFQGPAAWYTSPEYVSPEVLGGGPPVPATDVYAFGLVLHEMLTGAPPYRGPNPDAVIAAHLRGEPAVPVTVPPHLRHLVEECLELDPAARPSARELAQRLRYVETSAARDIAWSEIVATSPSETEQIEIASPRSAPSSQPSPSQPSPLSPLSPTAPPVPSPRRPATGRLATGRLATSRLTPGRLAAGRRPSGRFDSRRGALVVGAALFVVAALVAVGVLVATDDEPVGDGPAPASVTTGVVAAQPAPPTPAASATAETLEGATAFVTHWFESLTYAIATGDTAPLQAASSPQCRACADAATVVRDGYRDLSTLRGGGYTVRTVSADDFWTIERPALRVVFDRSPRSAVGPGGELAEVFPAGSFLTCQVLLERADDRWRVLEVLAPSPIA